MKPKLTTCLWLNDTAEEAAKFYKTVFKDFKLGRIVYYSDEAKEIHGHDEGEVLTIEFKALGHQFMLLNGGPQFKFNEAMSIVIDCDTQREIDYYWKRLTAGGGEEGPCGWLKDRYGVSWQVNPRVLSKMLCDKDRKKVARVTSAFMNMKKFDIKALQKAFKG